MKNLDVKKNSFVFTLEINWKENFGDYLNIEAFMS